MVLKNFGDEKVTDYDFNNQMNNLFTIGGIAEIRKAMKASVSGPVGGIRWFNEAYTDSNGRGNSVVTNVGSTTAYFETDSYKCFDWTTDTLGSPYTIHQGFTSSGSISNSGASYDNNTSTSALISCNGVGTTPVTFWSGRTFPERYVNSLYYNFRVSVDTDRSSDSTTVDAYAQIYNGSTWNTIGIIENINNVQVSGAYSGFVDIGSNCQGARLWIYATGYSSPGGNTTYVDIFEVHVFDETMTPKIHHTIPTGTFSGSISRAFGTPLYETFTGSSVTYFKLTNTLGEDTGWLPSNKVSEFKAFTSEPNSLIVSLDNSPRTTYVEPIVNGDIEADITGNWTFEAQNDSLPWYSGAGRTTDAAIEGATGLEIVKTGNDPTGDEFAYYYQSGVDLTNTGTISFYSWGTYDVNTRVQLYHSSIGSYNVGAGTAGTQARTASKTIGSIPSQFQISGVTVRIGTYGFVSDNHFHFYMDAVNTTQKDNNVPGINGFAIRCM